MELINKIFDNRISANNLLFEISIEDYFKISEEIIDHNEFQRRRVKSSSTIYNLLRKDLKIGCIIPPLVLALSSKEADSEQDDPVEVLKKNTNKLIILDGLQRTHTIRDVYKELVSNGDEEELEHFKKSKIRIEVYIGVNKLGILYRMLTLNTGQTAMTMRHQIEILYSDYLNTNIGGIKLLLESNDKTIKNFDEYKFKDAIEGFTSYLDRDYLPMNRSDLLENIESLEKLSSVNQERDLFREYLNIFHSLVVQLKNNSNDWCYDAKQHVEDSSSGKPLSGQPFGNTVEKTFKKSQVMTGFGSAVGKLIDFKVYDSITDLEPLLAEIKIKNSEAAYANLLSIMDNIKNTAKKIGNDQRLFFHFFFRALFDKKSDSYLILDDSINEAFSDYLRKTS